MKELPFIDKNKLEKDKDGNYLTVLKEYENLAGGELTSDLGQWA